MAYLREDMDEIDNGGGSNSVLQRPGKGVRARLALPHCHIHVVLPIPHIQREQTLSKVFSERRHPDSMADLKQLIRILLLLLYLAHPTKAVTRHALKRHSAYTLFIAAQLR